MTTPLELARQYWAETLKALNGNLMTRASFEQLLQGSEVVTIENGTYQIGIRNEGSLEWLEKPSTKARVYQALSLATEGAEISLKFILLPSALPGPERPAAVPPEETLTGPSEAGQHLASLNYYSVYFEAKGTGFSQVPHPYVRFWQFLLGPAFGLYLYLSAEDTSRLTKNPATWWTQPKPHSFEELTQKLNKKHPRYVAGDELECTRSLEWRKEGKPLRGPADCCGGFRYEWLRFKQHPKAGCGVICHHWSVGLLEILAKWQLVVIELGELGYKCKIQTWRMLPYPTPYQISLLHPTIQKEFEAHVREYGSRLDPPLYYPFWKTTTETNIVPLLPFHDLPELTHTFDLRRNYQEFKRHAVRNPHYAAEQEEADEVADEVL